jgi:YesN/AraC family two-component response regulator
MITILIADDQTLMREGLKTILDLENDMRVIGTAENGQQAYEMVREHKPDIVLMDIKMPVMDGIESTKKIKKDFPHTHPHSYNVCRRRVYCRGDGKWCKRISIERHAWR